MKFVLIPILMMLILAQAFSKWLVVAEYKVNQDFISRNLCINKSRPKLHCNGKCQMMKRLAEEEKQDSSNNTNNSSKVKVQEVLFCSEIKKPAIPSLTCEAPIYNEEPILFRQHSLIDSIFHPPAVG
ncbi:MAG TPA: hypothetical protein VI385_02795 [Flavisolibacter sp.]